MIAGQVARGYTFEGTVLNIATQKEITFFTKPNSHPGDPTTAVNVTTVRAASKTSS